MNQTEFWENNANGFLEDWNNLLANYAQINNCNDGFVWIKSSLIPWINQYTDIYDNSVDVSSIEDFSSSEKRHYYLLHYKLPIWMKEFLILQRTSWTNGLKSTIYSSKNKEIDQKEVVFMQKLHAENNSFTINMLSKWKSSLSISIDKIEDEVGKIINPFRVYTQQFDQFIKQFEIIVKTHAELPVSFQNLKEIDQLSMQSIQKLHEHANKLQVNIHQLSEVLTDAPKYDDVLNFVKKSLLELMNFENHELNFSNEIHAKLVHIPSISIPLPSSRGEMQVKKVELSKSITDWMDYYILPHFSENYQFLVEFNNEFVLHLNSIKNSLESVKETEISSWDRFQFSKLKNKKFTDFIVKENEDIESLKEKFATEFDIQNLFKDRPFLPISIGVSIENEKQGLIQKIKEKSDSWREFLKLQKKSSLYEQNISPTERLTRMIQERMKHTQNEWYDNFFLNKNFVADFFIVNRDIPQRHLVDSFDFWKNGGVRNVLIHGKTFSGKTAFVQHWLKQQSDVPIIELAPNTSAVIDGRKFDVSDSLLDALQYIKNNNSKNSRPIVLMDDLHQWNYKKNGLLSDVRALIQFLQTESTNCFVVVAINDLLLKKIDKRLGILKHFTTQINLNDTELEEIQKAVEVRHLSTHTSIVNDRREALSPLKLNQKVKELEYVHSSNIGSVLQAWTFHLETIDEKTMLWTGHEEILDFDFSPEEKFILTHALTYRKINEIRLKNYFAGSYSTAIQPALRRMLNYNILLRTGIGDLVINPVLIVDIEQLIS